LVNKTSNFTPGLNDQATQKQWLSELDQHGQHPNPTLNEQLQKVPDLNDTTQLLDATDNFKDLKSSQQALNNVNQQSGQDGSIILKHQQNLAKMGIAPTEYTKFLRQGMFPEKVSDVNQPKEMIKKWDDLSEANQKLIMDGKGEALDKFLHTYYEPLANVMEADPKYNPEINEYKKGMVTANIGKRPLDYLMTGTGVPGKVRGIIDAFGGPAIADKIMSLPSKYAEMLATGKIDDNPKTGIGYALSRLVQYLQTTGNLNPPKDTDNSSGAK
jgi:hypothetical protein